MSKSEQKLSKIWKQIKTNKYTYNVGHMATQCTTFSMKDFKCSILSVHPYYAMLILIRSK